MQAVNERPDDFQVSLVRIVLGSEAVKVLDTQPAPIDTDESQLSTDLMPTFITMIPSCWDR